MRRFLKNLIIFSMLLAAMLVTCEFYARSQSNLFNYRERWMSEHANEVELLISGNSQTFLGVDPKYFLNLKAFKVAYNGQCLDMDYYYLLNHIDRMPKLKYYVVSMSVWSPFATLTPEKQTWHDRVQYMNETDPTLLKPWDNLEIAYPEHFRTKVLPWLHSHIEQIDSLGHPLIYRLENRPVNWRKDFVDAKFAVIDSQEEVDRSLEYIEKLCNLCQNHGIDLIFVLIPHHHDYICYTPPLTVDRFYSTMDSLQQVLPFRFLDYLQDERFDDEVYDDGCHLNTDVGAEKFTRILYEDIMAGRGHERASSHRRPL